VELPSLTGDVALKDGIPVVHAHAVIGKKDGYQVRRKPLEFQKLAGL
jgi:predicted DNA-binding protein with PD1-like motif